MITGPAWRVLPIEWRTPSIVAAFPVQCCRSGHSFRIHSGGTLWESHPVADQSSHLKTEQQPLGANIGFLDGHVAWRHFKDMELRYSISAGLTFWW